MSLLETSKFKKRVQNQGTHTLQRPYDDVYDSVHTVSGEMEHAREHQRARATVRRTATDPTLSFIDRRWRRSQGSLQLTGPRSSVTGADQWKYFKRPRDVSMPKSDLLPVTHRGESRNVVPLMWSVGVQTMFRDSETQTDPYSPEFVERPGSAPLELLALTSLTWGRGLPAGPAELEQIERARMRKKWEATLPPLTDLTQLEERRKMMEEMERKELALREQQIDEDHEDRLSLLKKNLQEYVEKQEQVTKERVLLKFSKLQNEKEIQLKKIHKEYMTAMRKLLASQENIEGKLKRRDIVKDYTDYGSKVYAPLPPIAQLSEQNINRSVEQSHFLSTYDGLQQLEAGFNSNVLEPQIEALNPKASRGFIHRSVRLDRQLEDTFQSLKDKKVAVPQPPKKLSRLPIAKEKPIYRPPTPVVTMPTEGEEEVEQAAIVLQKLLRGRMVHFQMFKGKEKHLDLIKEVASTYALLKDDQEKKELEKQVVQDMQRKRDVDADRVDHKAALSGGVIADMLDFLSKELIRQQEESRIHAFLLMAERERRIREAEESGRRQLEEKRRIEEDEIFNQVVRVHQDTVDMYLKDVILSSIDQTADVQARQEMQSVAEELNDKEYSREMRNSRWAEEIVADLVHGFLIPEVQKINVRERVLRTQQRHLQAARSLINLTTSSADSLSLPLQTPKREVSVGSSETVSPAEKDDALLINQSTSTVVSLDIPPPAPERDGSEGPGDTVRPAQEDPKETHTEDKQSD